MTSPTAKSMTRAEAAAFLLHHPGARAEFSTRDATGDHWIRVRCWLDEDGELVMPHPTDAQRGPIAAPDGVEYSLLLAGQSHSGIYAVLLTDVTAEHGDVIAVGGPDEIEALAQKSYTARNGARTCATSLIEVDRSNPLPEVGRRVRLASLNYA